MPPIGSERARREKEQRSKTKEGGRRKRDRRERISRLIRHTCSRLLLHFDDHLAHEHAIIMGESGSSVTA